MIHGGTAGSNRRGSADSGTDDVLLPPHDTDAEVSLLGSMMLAPDVVIAAVDAQPQYFYDDRNAAVCGCLLTMHTDGQAIDPVTVSDTLRHTGQLSRAGGVEHIYRLTESVPHPGHARYYAGIVKKCWQRRQLQSTAELIRSESRHPDADIQHVLTTAIRVLSEAAQSGTEAFSGQAVSDLWSLADAPVEWLVDGVFSADQPTIFGAKQKSLKTTLLTDLAVSLATGFPWLGRFEIPQRRRVLFLTGEASAAAAIRKVRRAAEFRNLRAGDIGDSLRIEATRFPSLPDARDCQAVAAAVATHGVQVVIVDPLYMGLQGLNTANLTEVGPALRQFMAACRPANVVIAHHVKKSASYDDAPNLEDLSQAGIAEFAGNFWLMGRMGEYTGDGLHSLAIRYGGRDEQFGLLKLDFNERDWTADFTSLLDHREDLKQRQDTERVNRLAAAVKGHLSRHGGQATLSALADAAGTKPSRESFQQIIDELCESGQYTRVMLKGGNNKECEGLQVNGQMATDSVL